MWPSEQSYPFVSFLLLQQRGRFAERKPPARRARRAQRRGGRRPPRWRRTSSRRCRGTAAPTSYLPGRPARWYVQARILLAARAHASTLRLPSTPPFPLVTRSPSSEYSRHVNVQLHFPLHDRAHGSDRAGRPDRRRESTDASWRGRTREGEPAAGIPLGMPSPRTGRHRARPRTPSMGACRMQHIPRPGEGVLDLPAPLGHVLGESRMRSRVLPR